MISYNCELSDWMSIILQIWDNFYVISLQVFTKEKQNTRRIYQDSRFIIKHIQAYSGIIQAYSEPCAILAYSELWYIQNPGIFKTRGIFRTLVYPKLWHIQNQRLLQNPGLFRTLGYSEPEAYSESCQTSMMECFEKQLTAIIILAGYNYFRNISFSSPPVHELNMIF